MAGRAYLVYNADGGLLGEARYFARKWAGVARCDLCDITHRGFFVRPAWTAAMADLDVDVIALHRNELDPDLARFVGTALPCVVAEHPDGYAWIGRPEQVRRWVGAPATLAAAISEHFSAQR